MVAVVSGNGLGLFNTSLTQLGFGLGGQAGIGQGRTSQLVNIATGNLILQDQDESLSVRGFSTSFLRTYNSRGTVTGAGQDGFVTGYERKVALSGGALNAAGSTMTLTTGDGQTQLFSFTSANLYTSTAGDGANDTLTWDGTARTWTYVEGSSRRQETYADHANTTLLGRLTRIRDLTSDGITPAQFDIIYDASNRVSEVRSVDGTATPDEIVFGYDASSRLISVNTREGGLIRTQLTYGYDSVGRLSWAQYDLTPGTTSDNTPWDSTTPSANNGVRFRTTYAYVTTSATDLRIASVSLSDGTVVGYTYQTDGRLSTVTLGDTNTNDADGLGETVTFTYTAGQTDVTDSLGRTWTYLFDATNQLTAVRDPAVNGLRNVTTYSYTATGDVAMVKHEAGTVLLSQTNYTYDANGNALAQYERVSAATGSTVTQVVLRTYSTTNQLLTETTYTGTDADGAVTAGAATGIGLVTNFIYDGQDRLRFTVDATGAVTERTYAVSGNGIGQVASERRYFGAAYASTMNASALATWATAAQMVNSELTESGYDAFGRLQSQIRYATVDATTGAGKFDTGTEQTLYAYDPQGLLLKKVVVHGASSVLALPANAPLTSEVTDYVYEGLGRLLSAISHNVGDSSDALTLATTYAYTDSGKQIVVTQDSGALLTQTFNSEHRLLSSADWGVVGLVTVTRTTQNFFDSAGQLRATQDANGGRHYYFYNIKGLLEGKVDETGALTEYGYDGERRLISTQQYSIRADTSTWLVAGNVVPTSFAAVRPDWSTDFAALPIAGLDTSHVNLTSEANIIRLSAGRLAFDVNDNPTVVTPNISRTATHSLTENIGYRGEVTTGTTQANTFLLMTITSMTAPVNRAGAFFRNGNLYLNTYVDGVGSDTLIGATAANTTYVVEAVTRDGGIDFKVYIKGQSSSSGFVFSASAESRQWGAAKLVVYGYGGPGYVGDALYLDNLSETDFGIRTNVRTYDLNGRLATATDAVGTKTTYSYDEADRLLQTVVADAANTAATARTTRYFYDNASRLLGTLDAEHYLTENSYDAGGRLVKTTGYSTQTLSSANWTSGTLTSLRPVTTAADTGTRYFYDSRGTLIGQLEMSAGSVASGSGYLTEYVNDAQGNQRAVKVHAKLLTGLLGTESIATLRTAAATPALAFQLTQRSFNGLGQLITELNAEGTVTTYTYDEAGRLLRTEAAQGTTEVRENYNRYDVFGNLIGQLSGQQAADAGGVAVLSMGEPKLDAAYARYGTTHAYDLLGRRIETVEATLLGETVGAKTWFFYDGNGRQNFTVRGVNNGAVKNALGEVTETRYSAFGQVVDQIAYTGRIAITTPGSRASVQNAINVLAYVAASDSKQQRVYDTRGLLAKATDAEGVKTFYGYTAFGQLDTQTVAQNTAAVVVLQHGYDRRGLETSHTDAPANAILSRTVSQSYDAFGRISSQIDSRGVVSYISYDRMGRQLGHSRTVDGRVEASSATYDAFDRVLSQTDAMGRVTTYVHSDTAQSLQVTSPEGVVITTVHNRFGQSISITRPIGIITLYTFDKNGALLTTTNQGQYIASNSYDVLGRLSTATDASGVAVSFAYDAVGRISLRVEDPGTGHLNLSSTYSYDGQGRVLTATDPSGRVTSTSYDRQGRVLQIAKDPSGLNLRTTYSYDGVGRQLTVTEGAGTAAAQTTQYDYDALGRRITQIVAPGVLNLSTSYGYDKNDNVVLSTSPIGAVTRFTYNEDNRIRFSVDSLGDVTETAYDADGRISMVRSYTKPITGWSTAPTTAEIQGLITAQLVSNDAIDAVNYRVYDRYGRLVLTVDGSGTARRTAYDAAGRVCMEVSFSHATVLTPALRADLTAGTATLASASVADATTDQVMYYWRDGADLTVEAIDGLGRVQETSFDAARRPLGTYSHVTPIANFETNTTLKAALAAGTAGYNALGIVTDTSIDSQNCKVYDTAGRLRYTVDGAGGVKRISYDAAGNVTERDSYPTAVPVSSALWNSIWYGLPDAVGQLDGLLAAAKTLGFDTSFDGGSLAGFNPSAVPPPTQDGRVVFAYGAQNTSISRAGTHTLSEALTYRAEITTGTTVGNTNFGTYLQNSGIWNTAAFQREGMYVYNGDLHRQQINGTVYTDVVIGTVKANTSYVIEYDTLDGLITTYVYEKGLNREAGYSFSRAISSATFGTMTWTAESGTGTAGGIVYLDNYAELSRKSVQVEAYRYDGAGRLLRTINGLGQAEEYRYDAAGNRIATVDVLGNTHRSVYDVAGRLVYAIDPLGGFTRNWYAANGRLTATYSYAAPFNTATLSDATTVAQLDLLQAGSAENQGNFYVYDSEARLRFSLNVLGGLVETTYDGAGREVSARSYGTLFTSSSALNSKMFAGTATPADIVPTASTAIDRVVTRVYDASGRVLYSLSAINATQATVSEHRYDGLGRLVAEVAYALPITNTFGATQTAAQVAAVLGTANYTTAANQHLTRYVYDNIGQLRYTIDDAGYVSENVYDSTRQLVQTRKHAIKTGLAGQPTVAQVAAALVPVGVVWTTEFDSSVLAGVDLSSQMNAKILGGSLILQSITQGAYAYPRAVGTTLHTLAENLTYRTDFTTGSSVAGTVVFIGIANDSPNNTAAYRQQAVLIVNNIVYMRSTTGTVFTDVQIGTVNADSSYIVEQETRDGQIITYVYAKDGTRASGMSFTRAVTSADFGGLRWRVSCEDGPDDSSGPLYINSATIFANGQAPAILPSETYRYDVAGNVIATIDALGHVSRATYDALGQKLTATDALGNTTTSAYDAVGRLLTETGPAVNVWRFDDAGNPVTNETKQIVTANTYDAAGNVLTRTDNATAANANDRHVTQYVYDALGRQITTIFPNAWEVNAAGVLQAIAGASPQVETVYNTLGQAVVQKDVLGQYSYRAFDAAGRLAYEVDANACVTAYTYNALGQQTGLTRYANPLNTAGFAGWIAGKAMRKDQVASGITAGNDRSITSVYDNLGNNTSVVMNPVIYYKNDGTSATGAPTTNFTYDLFGRLVKDSVLLEGTTWADTFHYYDSLGRESMTVDPEGYVTATVYDGLGQVIQSTQYARALNSAGLTTTAMPGVPAEGDASTGYDRITRYQYDAAGRKISETIVSHYQLAGGAAAVRDVVTRLGYDAEGHTTRLGVDGIDTLTSYDALGHVVSIQEAERDVLRSDAEARIAASSTLNLAGVTLYERASPYTTLNYDAFGNQIRVTRYANGMRNGTVTADAARDQVTTTRFDRQGRAVIETDAEGNKSYKKYDAADNLIETWSRLDNNDGRYAIVRTTASYDNLGRQSGTTVVRELWRSVYGTTTAQGTYTDSIERVTYNSFGEPVSKGFDGVTQPLLFTYNAVGRLVTSNAEGGVTRNFGYNLAGAQVYEAHQTLITAGVFTATTLRQADKIGRFTRATLPAYSATTSQTPVVCQRFDRWGNVLEQVDARGYVTTMEYNSSNQLTRTLQPLVLVVNADGTSTWQRTEYRTFRDALGRAIAEQDANGNTERTLFDATGRAVRNTDAMANSRYTAFDALGNERLTQDGLGRIAYQKMNRLGQVTSQGDFLPDNSGLTRSQTQIERYTLNQDGDRLSVTDALNATQRYDYDSRQLLIRSQSAMGVITEYEYDTLGRKVREMNALSNNSYAAYTTPSYNGGLVLEVIQQQGTALNPPISPRASFTVPSGETLACTVDFQRYQGSPAYRYVSVTDSGLSYDAATDKISGTPTITGYYNMVVTITSASGKTLTKTIALSVLTPTDYTAAMSGKPRVSVGLMDQPIISGIYWQFDVPANTFFDPTGQPLTYSAQIGQWVEATYEYDAELRRRLILEPAHWEFRALTASDWVQFDAVNKRFSGTPNAVGTWHLMVTATDPDGNTASTSLNLRSTAIGSSTTGITDRDGEIVQPNEQTWNYDAFGRLIDHNDLSGVDFDYVLDSTTGQNTSQSSGWTQTYGVQYAYSSLWGAVGALFSTLPQQVTTAARSLKYYANGQLQEMVEGSGATARTYRFQYDAAGNRTLEESETMDPNGALVKLRTRISYDSHNRIETVVQEDYTATLKTILDISYSYDANGNRRRIQARGALSSTATITAPNDAPTVIGAPLANRTLRAVVATSFRIRLSDVFHDAEYDPLSITWAGLPTGLTAAVDTATGELVFTANGTAALGTSTITLTATSLSGTIAAVSTAFTVTFVTNSGPALLSSAVPTFNAKLNTSFSVQLAAATYFSDIDVGDSLDLSVIAKPTWLQVDSTSPGALRFIGTPTVAGSYTLTIRATDAAGAYVDKSVTVVAAANFAPTAIGQAGTTFVIGRINSWDSLLSNVFVDSDGNLAGVNATLADGSPLPSWMSLETVNFADGPHLLLAGQPPTGLGDNTVYNIKLTAIDALGSSSSTTFTVTAKLNRAPTMIGTIATQSLRVNQLTSYSQGFSAAALFSDADGDSIDYSLVFAANDPTSAWLSLSFDRSTGILTLAGTPWDNTQAGTHVVQLAARDADGATSLLNITYQIAGNNAPVYAGGLADKVLIAGHTVSFGIPATAFTDADGDALTYTAFQLVTQPGHYDAEGYWEPAYEYEAPLTGWLTFNGTTFNGVVPSSSYPMSIAVRATDVLNRTAETSFTVSVTSSAGNTAPVYTTASLVNRSATAGQPVDFLLPANSFSDANGDALSYSLLVLVGANWVAGSTIGLAINASTGQITGTLTNATQASYSIKVTASDGIAAASGTFTLAVANGAPTVPNPAPDQWITTGAAFTYAVPAFSDPNGDTLTYSATGLPANVTFNTTSRQFGGVPAAGTYTITISATDGKGGSVSDSFVLNVGAAQPNVAPTVNQAMLDGLATYSFAGDFVSIDVAPAFSDANGDALTYSILSGRPLWLTINASTGLLTGTASIITKDFSILLSVSDGHGGSVTGTLFVSNDGGGTRFPTQTFLADDGTAMAQMIYNDPEDPPGGGTGGGSSFSSAGQDVWYSYDAENRVVVANGMMSAGQILLSTNAISAAYTYDANGDQISRTMYLNSVVQVERRTYNLRGQEVYAFQPVTVGAPASSNLLHANTYDATGRLVKQVDYYGSGTTRAASGGGSMSIQGWIKHAENYIYDLDGRVTSQSTWGRVLGWTATTGHTISDESDQADLTNLSTVSTYYDSLSRSSGYAWKYLRHDEGYLGAATDAIGYTHTYAITYEARDSYLEKSIYGKSTNTTFKASISTMQYDAWGRLIGVRENTPHQSIDDQLRYFAYDAEGAILRRREGTYTNSAFTQTTAQSGKDSVFAYASGNQLAEQTRDGTRLDVYGQYGLAEASKPELSKDQKKAAAKSASKGNHLGAYDSIAARYTAFDAGGIGARRVTVQSGDTLQSLAQRVYGNSSLWYVLGSANAISSSTDLIAGTQLRVPDVGTSKNDSTTFKPYNPSAIIGNTSPNLPYIPPPPKLSCGQTVAMILATVVRVVAQWVGHILMATGTFAWLAPIVGAVGEFAAQSIEKNAGLREEYNWGAVAVAAVSAMIVGSEETTIPKEIGKAMLTAASSYVGSYLVNRAIGKEDHFSLRSLVGQVAVAGVTAGLSQTKLLKSSGGSMVSSANGQTQLNWSAIASSAVTNSMKNVVTNAVDGLVYSAVTGEKYKFDLRSSLANALASGIGETVGAVLAQKQRVQPWFADEIAQHDARVAARKASQNSGSVLQSSTLSVTGAVTDNSAEPAGHFPNLAELMAGATADIGHLSLASDGDENMPMYDFMDPKLQREMAKRADFYGSRKSDTQIYNDIVQERDQAIKTRRDDIATAMGYRANDGVIPDALTKKMLAYASSDGYGVGSDPDALIYCSANGTELSQRLVTAMTLMHHDPDVASDYAAGVLTRGMKDAPGEMRIQSLQALLGIQPTGNLGPLTRGALTGLFGGYAAGGTQSTGSVLELGKNQAYADDIRFASDRTGIDQRVLASVINAEAAKEGGVWQANSYNKASRAGGLTQFIPGTWKDEAMRSYTYLNQIARERGYVDSKNRTIPTYADKLLDMRFESKMAITAAAEYDSLMFNRYTSGVVGADVRNDVTKFAYYLYLGHHEGGRGAVDFVNGSLSRKNPEPWARTLMAQNVPRSQQASLIANANGNVYSAYRGWLDGYITNNIKPLNYSYRP